LFEGWVEIWVSDELGHFLDACVASFYAFLVLV
jgi:hypothetical protein